jgi:hypothetical protein
MKLKSIFITALLGMSLITAFAQKEGIYINKNDPGYWYYNGQKTLLVGGSNEDNLFQSSDYKEQIKLLKDVGGNYVRNTMSARDKGNVWPFAIEENGKYNLNKYNPEYWERFEQFLEETQKNDVIVQIEIWATFDFYRDEWLKNPFNPKNNINYDHFWSKLDTVIPSHPTRTRNNFFRSVPSQMALHKPLYYQQKFVDKLLEISLQYDHVLYCMDNETSVNSDWAKFWVDYIKKTASMQNKTVYCTEMWDPHELDHAFHYETFDNPAIFDFVDISQNNHKSEDEHWFNGLAQFERLKKMDAFRPVNNVKIYGNDGGKHKTTYDAINSFVQNVLMGCASARFHRPTSGQGINQTAQNCISSMNKVVSETRFFDGTPDLKVLSGREKDEAYCRNILNEQFIVYFPSGGEVNLNTAEKKNYQVQWINIKEAKYEKPESVKKENITLKTPGDGHWIAIIK